MGVFQMTKPVWNRPKIKPKVKQQQPRQYCRHQRWEHYRDKFANLASQLAEEGQKRTQSAAFAESEAILPATIQKRSRPVHSHIYSRANPGQPRLLDTRSHKIILKLKGR